MRAKKTILFVALTSLIVSSVYSFKSPLTCAKNIYKSAYAYSGKTKDIVWRNKWIVSFLALAATTGTVLYYSEYVREKIKELLGLTTEFDHKDIRPLPYRSQKIKEEACACELESEESVTDGECACEEDEACECACELEDETSECACELEAKE